MLRIHPEPTRRTTVVRHRFVALPVLLAAFAAPATAEVYECLHEDGRVLLTDVGCPPDYAVNLVVPDPLPVAQPAPAAPVEAEPEAAAQAEAARRAAEAEAARLRAELEAERLRNNALRLDALDRKVDTLLERPEVYGGVGVVPVPALPWCGERRGRPWVDCRPRQAPPRSRADRPDPRDSCGTFGCTPGIISAPWDDERRTRGSN